MVDRIKEIIVKEGLTSGSFADLIGVQRSSMSHILNGRNNPSLDFIIKTLQAFPRINPEWLLMGTGSFYRSDEPIKASPKVRELSIFDSVPEPVVSAPTPDVAKAPEKQVETPVKAEKFVNKVLLFYSDHTYDEFFKADSQES